MRRALLDPRAVALAIAAISGAMALYILHYTQYPFPVWRGLIFQYLLRHQDLAGLALVAALALGACLPATHRPALALVQKLGERPWTVALVAFLALCTGMLLLVHDHALAGDEYLTLMQSRIFASGHLTGQYPPDLLGWLMPDHYRYRWIMVSADGRIAATYWPGFALVLTPFTLLGAPWACNPALAALSLVLMAKLAARLAGGAQAAGWAMLFALASPGFTGLALSYFSMTAHLAANLAFAWLLLAPTPRRLVAAGLVGSLALLLHQPVPHMLFAAPWLAWLALQPRGRRNLALVALGYLPGVVGGVAWAAFLRELHGFIVAAPFPSDGELGNRIGNLIWYWQLRTSWIFDAPAQYAIDARLGEQVRLWAWAAPGLPLLAAAGWWMNRRDRALDLFALSLAATLLGYLLVRFDQGYGWGARYVHPAFGALTLLAAAGMMRLAERPDAAALRGWAAAAAASSLVFATGLRGWQIETFIAGHLSHRPPYVAGEPQVVFIKHDVDYYFDWDLVQNDPYLRSPTLVLLSRGAEEDARMMARRFPQARRIHSGPHGEVWKLD
jgi:hypothetical protein